MSPLLSIRFQADNDLKFAIVKAVRRREPAIDFRSAGEAGLEGVSDPELLERAERDNRVLVSQTAGLCSITSATAWWLGNPAQVC